MGRFCMNCGTKLNDGDLFCPVCGNKVKTAEATQALTIDNLAYSTNKTICEGDTNNANRIIKYTQLFDEWISKKFPQLVSTEKRREKVVDWIAYAILVIFLILLNIIFSIDWDKAIGHFFSHDYWMFVFPFVLIGVHYWIHKYGKQPTEGTELWGKIIATLFVVGLGVALVPTVIGAIFFGFMLYNRWESIKKYREKPFFYTGILLNIICFIIWLPIAGVAEFSIGLLALLLPIVVLYICSRFYEPMKVALPFFTALISLGFLLLFKSWLKSDLNTGSTDVADTNIDSGIASASAASMASGSFVDVSSISAEHVNPEMGFDNASIVTGNVDVASANGVNFDNSTELNTVPDNMGPTQVTVTDMTGGTQETITQVSDNRYEIKDSMGITHGNVYVNDGTGETMINVDGQTLVESSNGEIRNPFDPNGDVAHAQPDGSVIVTDNMGQYAGGVTSDGTMVDAQMNPVGKIQKN